MKKCLFVLRRVITEAKGREDSLPPPFFKGRRAFSIDGGKNCGFPALKKGDFWSFPAIWNSILQKAKLFQESIFSLRPLRAL
jgi:hypothetical protein